jgi:hypothetical protein
MSPILTLCQLMNGTLVYHTIWQRNTTTISTTIDTTTGTMSSQTIAITVLAVLFTLSELLASIPEIGANGIVQGLIYYMKKGTNGDVTMNRDVMKKMSELKDEITRLSNQVPTTLTPPTPLTPPTSLTPPTPLTPKSSNQEYDVNQLSDQVAAISSMVSAKHDGQLNESELNQISSQVEEISRIVSQQPVPPQKYEGPATQMDIFNSMPPGISQSHYVADN